MNKQDASTGEIISDGEVTADDGKLHIKVYSPFKVYFDGPADSISAENDTGQFDVLLGHKNFLSLLNPCDVVIRKADTSENITITRGIIHVHDDKVAVFLDV